MSEIPEGATHKYSGDFYKKKGEDTWNNEVINMRKMDITKAIIVLQKAQEELLLHNSADEEE